MPEPFGVLAADQLSAKPTDFSRKGTAVQQRVTPTSTWHQRWEFPLGPSISHSTQPAHRNIWLGQEGTKCKLCSLWMCFRLINGHVKQRGGHFSHVSHPSFMRKIKLVCSAGMYSFAGHCAVEAMEIRVREIISESNSWFHLQLFANVCITNLKTFPAWLYEFPWKHRSWKSTSRATWKKFASLQNDSRFAWKEATNMSQAFFCPSTSQWVFLLQSLKHLYLIKYLCSFHHHSVNTSMFWEYTIWDLELQAEVFQTIKAPSGHAIDTSSSLEIYKENMHYK